MDIIDKNVVVVGGTSGIGLQVARRLLDLGALVTVVGHDPIKILNVVREEPRLQFSRIDILNNQEIERFFMEYNQVASIDILINCAGIGVFGEFVNLDVEQISKCIATNLTGIIVFTYYAAQVMVARKSGVIINVESIAATKGFKYGSVYACTKAGLGMFSGILWQELKRHNIRVASIKPGLVNTQFMKMSGFEDKNLNTALRTDDIADAVVFILSQSEHSNISDITIRPFLQEGQDLFLNILKESYE